METQKLPFPKSIFFIIADEFCERFSYYGMRTILSLYLVQELLYTENEAKVIFHASKILVYLCPIFGAIIADSYWGRYKTILYVSSVYVAGNIITALGSTPIQIPAREATLLGLILIGVGSGGIKPCVAAFGGDQFVLPQQQKQFDRFFSIFYFTVTAGASLSVIVSPILREHVKCFGKDSCYPLAFSVPGLLMLVALLIFVCGKSLYKFKKPEGNIFLKAIRCVSYAINAKFTSSVKTNHWLDFSEKKFGIKLVHDIKSVLKLFVVMLPMPMYWALLEQQGTVWTFQAKKMDGNVGSFTILPEQIHLVNPILILILLPVFDCKIYPIFKRWNMLTTHLQRIITGGFFLVLIFIISGCISLKLESDLTKLSTNDKGQTLILNSLECDLKFSHVEGGFNVQRFDYYNLNINETYDYDYYNCANRRGKTGSFRPAEEHESKSYFFYNLAESPLEITDNLTQISSKHSNVRTLVNSEQVISLKYIDTLNNIASEIDSSDRRVQELKAGKYSLNVNDEFTVNLEFFLGDVYAVIVSPSLQKVKVIDVAVHNRIHILWLIPQLILITIADILFNVTAMKFVYSQSPISIKTIIISCWLLTSAFGNVIIVIVETIHLFENQSSTTFMYTALMIADLALFIFLAQRYEYYKEKEEETAELQSV